MFASSGLRVWVRRAFALGAAVLACAAWSDSGTAAPGILFPATSAYHGRNYDPFDEPAPQAVDASPAIDSPASAKQASAKQASAKQASVSTELHDGVFQDVLHDDVVLHDSVVQSDFRQPILQSPADDPFDRLPPATSAAIACAYQPNDYQAVDYQPTDFQPAAAPTRAEPLPVPQPKYEQEQSEEAAGSTWSAKPVCELSTDIMLPGGLLPKNHWSDRPQQFVACGNVCGTTRGWPVNTFTWVASCLCHNPLYFEEINLERYGYGCGCYGPCCSNCLQSAVSAAHFFGTIPALPWEMAVDCPGECDYSLGYYRPGSCPPWRYNCCTQPSCLGALAEGGAATALIFLIP